MQSQSMLSHLNGLSRLCCQLRLSCRQNLRDYAAERSDELERSYLQLKYERFAWAAVIGFPGAYAGGFGEYGSRTWRLWAQRFQSAGVPVKSCVFHWLLLTYGA